MFFLSTHLPSVLIKGLKQLHENQKNNPVFLENKSASGVPNSTNSSVQHVQIRVAHLEDNTPISPSPMTALQIPVQITHVASTDSPAATVDPETITLNSGTLQTFEILPSFHLQPTGTPGTYLLQTSSSQGLPLTLTASPTVTLTAAAPASPEQIIVHALSDLESPTIEEQVDQTTIDDETILIVPSPHGFIQASDVIDTLPLTTLTDPILQHHQEESNIIGSSLGSPVSEDSKDVEDLVHCH